MNYAVSQGEAKGKAEGKAEIALAMLQHGMKPETIANLTGLSPAAIQELDKNKTKS